MSVKAFYNITVMGLLALLVGCGSMQPSTPEPAAETAASAEGVVGADGQQPVEPVIPDEAALLFDQALVAMQGGRVDQARENLEQLVRAYPTFSGPYLNLGLLSLQEEKFEDARSYFEKAIGANPKNEDAYVALGLLDRQEGRFEQAEQMYLKAIELNPGNDTAHLNLGIVYDLYMGKLPQALEHYKAFQSLQNEPVEQVKFWIVDIESRLN